MSESNQRRHFLKTGAGITAAVGAMHLGMPVLAQQKKFVRYSVASAQGKKMLETYARGVAIMMDKTKFPETDPRSWMFQWYTHSVRGDRSKTAELQRVFPTGGPNRALAVAMWNTCEAHFNASRENFFLPWHRAYVAFLERIIRKVTGDNTFALPYWDYTDVNQRILPEEFRKPADPRWSSLYRPDRKGPVNNGSRIDTLPGSLAITLNALRSGIYGDSPTDAGFCANVDGDPHGSIHVDVGNQRGMGQVPWAANDPIFWLHHCNIDRLWASWNKAGGRNPKDGDFLKEKFTFADENGKSATAQVANYLDMGDYEYDSYVKRPPGSAPFPSGAPLAVARHASRAEAGGVKLTGAALTVDLAPEGQAAGGPSAPVFAKRIESLSAEKTLYLRLEGVTAKADPGIGYDVYIGPTAPAKPDRDHPSFLGSLTFFGAGHDHHDHEAGAKPAKNAKPDSAGRNYSFVVANEARKLLSAADVKHPRITLIPSGELPGGTDPLVAKIALVSS
jgi:tyrosinase